MARDLLTLTLGDARFGIWMDEVLEVGRTPPISRLPVSAPEVPGVTSIRGEIIPVLDLGLRLLGSPAARPGRLVLVRHEESESLVGLLVDGVGTVADVASEDVDALPPEAEAELPGGYATGVVSGESGVVTILHLGRAAAPPEHATEG